MAYLVKRTVTRPNTSVSFFAKTAGFESKLNAEKTAGTLLSTSETVSADGLTMVTTALWANKAAHQAFCADADAASFFQARKNHYTSNGCTVVRQDNDI